MTYDLRQDGTTESKGIAVYVNPETKEVERDETEPIWFGTFYKESKGELCFFQNDVYTFDLEDIRLLAKIDKDIQEQGFDKIYDIA